MIHKATHHFDLVNWWLGCEPEVVQAYGKREFYTPKMAQAHGAEEPSRALPHLPRKGQVHVLPGHRRRPELQGRCTSTTRSTTAISATDACSGRTSASRTR